MFLKNIFAEKLENIKTEKVEVIENTNTVIFHVLSHEIIDFTNIENIEEKIRKHYNNAVDIEIRINYKLSKNINTLLTNDTQNSIIIKNKALDYKSLMQLQEIIYSSGISDVKVETTMSDTFGMKVNFSADIESSHNLISELHNLKKDIYLRDSKFYFDKNMQSYIELVVRSK